MDDEVPVAWIVVPAEAVAATRMPRPFVEPDSFTFENVAIIRKRLD
jgi:hypothetical protein